MPETRFCPACGDPLKPQRRRANPRKWCSEKCRVWAYHHPGEPRPTHKPCAWCAGPIDPDRNLGTLYCGHRCKLAAEGRLGALEGAALREGLLA